MKIALRLSYLGTAYHGWQRQKNGVTVQQRLEEAITEKIKQFGSLTALCARIDRSEEEVRGMLTSYYKALARLEKDVKEARP